MNRLLILVLLLSVLACNKSQSPAEIQKVSQNVQTPIEQEVEQDQTPSIHLNENIDLGIPVSTQNTNEILISRKQYVISWNQVTRNLNWASWKLQLKDFGKAKRGRFAPDPDLQQYLQDKNIGEAVISADYTNSCFNRGHIVPSADRNSTNEDNNTTFYMSNMTPQTSFLNQLAWGHLENVERDLVRAGKTLYIYSGPIYDKEMGAIGKQSDIKVPSKFFKIIVEFDATETVHTITKDTPMIIVIMPNLTSAGTWPDEDRETLCKDSERLPKQKADLNDWKKFQTTLEDVEQQTGLQFFEQNNEQILSPIIFAA